MFGGRVIFQCVDRSRTCLLQPSVDGHLGHFQISAARRRAAVSEHEGVRSSWLSAARVSAWGSPLRSQPSREERTILLLHSLTRDGTRFSGASVLSVPAHASWKRKVSPGQPEGLSERRQKRRPGWQAEPRTACRPARCLGPGRPCWSWKGPPPPQLTPRLRPPRCPPRSVF